MGKDKSPQGAMQHCGTFIIEASMLWRVYTGTAYTAVPKWYWLCDVHLKSVVHSVCGIIFNFPSPQLKLLTIFPIL